MRAQDLRIVEADQRPSDVAVMFREYADWLGLDLSFQNFEAELAALPGRYSRPAGRLYLAECAGSLAGCVALRPYDHSRCEMKRLFVRDAFRGLGLGRMLAEKIIAEAAAAGYSAMILDTLDSMRGALHLYEKLGFTPIAPYYDNPHPGALYLEKKLARA